MIQPDAPVSHPIRWISVEYLDLKKLEADLTSFYSEKVQPLFTNVKLLELLSLDPDYDKFFQIHQFTSYLSNITEETLWNAYQAGLLVAGNLPFTDFTKENTEAFYRLKLRSIETKQHSSLSNNSQIINNP